MATISNTQLNLTYWFYQKLPQIKKFIIYSWLILLGGSFIFTLFILTAELFKSAKHTVYLTQELNQIKNYQDSYFNLRPQKIAVLKSNILKTDNQRQDIIYLVNNPNRQWLVWNTKYQIQLGGNLISQDTFILPGEKWLSFLGSAGNYKSAPNLELEDINWYKLSIPQDLEKIKSLNFKTKKTIFVPHDQLGQNRAYITISNNSPFSFKQVEINGLAYKNNQLMALAKSEIEYFKTFEQREIFLGFGFQDIGPNPDIQIFVYVNVFDDSLILPFEAPVSKEDLE